MTDVSMKNYGTLGRRRRGRLKPTRDFSRYGSPPPAPTAAWTKADEHASATPIRRVGSTPKHGKKSNMQI